MEGLTKSELLALLYETVLASTNYRVVVYPDGKEAKQIWFNGNYWEETLLRKRLDAARDRVKAEEEDQASEKKAEFAKLGARWVEAGIQSPTRSGWKLPGNWPELLWQQLDPEEYLSSRYLHEALINMVDEAGGAPGDGEELWTRIQ